MILWYFLNQHCKMFLFFLFPQKILLHNKLNFFNVHFKLSATCLSTKFNSTELAAVSTYWRIKKLPWPLTYIFQHLICFAYHICAFVLYANNLIYILMQRNFDQKLKKLFDLYDLYLLKFPKISTFYYWSIHSNNIPNTKICQSKSVLQFIRVIIFWWLWDDVTNHVKTHIKLLIPNCYHR